MTLGNVRLILAREIRDQLRDRRTLFMIFVLPILLYPLLGMSLLQVSQFMREHVTRVLVVGAGELADLPPLFAGQRFAEDLFSDPSKAAMIAFTKQVAIQNAEYGIRANVILPGLMDTPMAVDTRARMSGKSRAEVAAERDARVPLRHKMGTAWDVANAALFLASDEARFITGAALPVDGGAMVRIG